MPKQPSIHEKPISNRVDIDLDQAIDKVLQVFGPNLGAFFAAIRTQVDNQRKESIAPTKIPTDTHVQ